MSLTSSGSQETLSVAKNWLEYCVENHDCYKSLFVQPRNKNQRWDPSDTDDERSTIYPTRLLDLQAFEVDCSDVRLIANAVSGSAYATLSHCWGSDCHKRYHATTNNLIELRARIRYTDLPKTYCDAISVCRSLKIRYLWIDSLCILQDSKEDWAREAANMAFVYSNSHLTISADWSTNSDDGCYRTFNLPPLMNTEDTFCTTNVLSNGERSCLYFPDQHGPGYYDLDFTHLAGRAWAISKGFSLDVTSISHRTSSFGNAGEDSLVRTTCLTLLLLTI